MATARAGEAPAPAKTESANPPVKYTERDYILEELHLVEQQLELEQKRAPASSDKILSLQRSVISLKRQLAAYDERTKRPDPADQERRRAAQEAQTREAEEQARRQVELKREMYPLFRGLAQEDPDAKVRISSVYAIQGLQLEESIPFLSQVVLTDVDNEVRQTALQAIISFRNETGANALLKLYDAVTDVNLKLNIVAGFQVQEKRSTVGGGLTLASVLPSPAAAKLIEIAKRSPVRELRRAALRQLGEAPGDEVTATLIGIYDESPDNEFRQMIVQYLGSRGGLDARQKLVAIAKSDADPRARQSAVDLLARLLSGSNLPSRPGRMPMPPPPMMVPGPMR